MALRAIEVTMVMEVTVVRGQSQGLLAVTEVVSVMVKTRNASFAFCGDVVRALFGCPLHLPTSKHLQSPTPESHLGASCHLNLHPS